MLKCVILDDEPLAVELLAKYIGETETLSLSFATTDVYEAIQFIQKNDIDVIFLDMQMPELTGLQVLKVIGSSYNVIFTTAYTDYALEGYEYCITDYLLKPISLERFKKAVDKLNIRTLNLSENNLGARNDDDFVFIKSESKMIKVNIKDVLFIEGLKDYISIQTNTEKLITLKNLKNFEEYLPIQQFMRIHKSYIVALNKIDSIERNRIFIDQYVIPIGDTYRDIFFERIGRNKI